MLCAIARNLDDDQLDAIKGLESDLGVTIVAFACREIDPAREERLRQIEAALGPVLTVPPAQPDDVQLTRIRETEQRIGLSLVAVES